MTEIAVAISNLFLKRGLLWQDRPESFIDFTHAIFMTSIIIVRIVDAYLRDALALYCFANPSQCVFCDFNILSPALFMDRIETAFRLVPCRKNKLVQPAVAPEFTSACAFQKDQDSSPKPHTMSISIAGKTNVHNDV